MTQSYFFLRRLRIMSRGRAVYDQTFHDGVNIIRGENGSGKSTISDFIFFVLGGEFDEWKDSAKQCDEVQAEIETKQTYITLRRAVASKLEPIMLFIGPSEKAMASPLDGWERFSIRRHGLDLSFSQIMFRYAGIPEAPSQKSSNITAHQILRLLYADQRTPASRLFRFEAFDTREIRTAVSDLIAGVNGYELYDVQLALRSLKTEFLEKKRELDSLFKVLPSKDGLIDTKRLQQQSMELIQERDQIVSEIENVDQHVFGADLKDFVEERKRSSANMRQLSTKIEQAQSLIVRFEAEISEIQDFIEYLSDLFAKLKAASSTSSLLGEVEFSHCPSCLRELKSHKPDGLCILCSEPLDEEEERSKFAHILYDTEMQLRENKQLLESKLSDLRLTKMQLREARENYKSALSSHIAQFEGGNSPREKFLAERNQRIGAISGDITRIERLMEIASRIDLLNAERAQLGAQIDVLEGRERLLLSTTRRRHNVVAENVSTIGADLLRQDLHRQDEFKACKSLELDYGDDAVSVDGKMNFSASSNVIAKNAAILSLFAAATIDGEMWHPRFALFDNIEDKGMEQARSHRFQELIVKQSSLAKLRHQIIFTTSMISPILDGTALCVGPNYTRENRTLALD